jgi:ParB-like nuclease domain/Winged helix-turn-helix DNA-binding
MSTKIEISQLRLDKKDWPRAGLNQERVGLFASVYQEGGELPPVEVVGAGDEIFLVADGVHRIYGAASAGLREIEAVITSPEPGEPVEAFVFRRGLETATTSSLPLTIRERRWAAQRLLEENPELSRREVARRVGLAHDTVNRLAREMAESSSSDAAESSTSPNYVTATDAARKLVGSLLRLDDARGFLDTIAPARMGRHLAEAYETRLGDDALSWARRFASWTAASVRVLEERE